MTAILIALAALALLVTGVVLNEARELIRFDAYVDTVIAQITAPID